MKKPSLPALFLLLALILPLASCGTAEDSGEGVSLVCVTSVYPASPEITEGEIMLRLYFQNPTETEYRYSKVTLDKLGGSEPESILLSSYSSGPIPTMDGVQSLIMPYYPIETGDYRLSYALSGKNGETRHEFKFSVIKKEDAKPPRWEASELESSSDEISGSEHISMIITNPDTIHTDEQLNIRLECDQRYTFGEPFSLEVSLDGQWYEVPYYGGFLLPLYSAGSESDTHNSFDIDLGGFFGPLPAGRYRLIKEFQPVSIGSSTWSQNDNPLETICAEFTLEQDML